MSKYQIIIGRSENVDIVGYALDIPAKIDTGAFRSAIHATDIRLLTTPGTKNTLQFNILGHPASAIKRQIVASEFSKVLVTSSNGETEERYEVSLKVKIGPKIFTTSFSLSDRSGNTFPILIGREALKGRFMVDVSKAGVDRKALLSVFGDTKLRDEEDLED